MLRFLHAYFKFIITVKDGAFSFTVCDEINSHFYKMKVVNMKVSPAQVEAYLKGISFPASKQDIIRQAEDNGADKPVLNILGSLREKEYHSPIDISKAIGKMK